MAKAKARRRSKGGSSGKAVPGAGRPRNPFAIVLRRRAAGAEPSPKAYRRRPKHSKWKPEIEE
jgi:hypothetical protein